MFDFTNFNWWAILAATAAAFALGGLWYGPLFGKAWLAAIGKQEDEIKPSPTPFVVSAATALVTCVVMAALVRALELTGWLSGAILGVVTGVGFIAASMASDHAFRGTGLKLWAIESAYRVLYAVIMGAIIGGWR